VRYDTLIIGAGMSGLAAGIRLAHFEKSVCVLERHTTIGGLNSFYRLRGRDYDVGLHAVTNYARPGTKTGPLSKLLRQLRFRWEDFALCPQWGSRVVFPGAVLRFNNDFALLESEVAARFPREIDGFRKLALLIEEQDLGKSESAGTTARQVMRDYIHDPLLVDMLLCPLMFYGSPTPHDMEFAQFGIMFRSIFREGFCRPYDGVRLILKQLVRRYKSLGGELRLRAGVRSIVSDGRRVEGVILDDGTMIEAENILSSAGHAETMRLCDHQPAADGSPPTCLPGDITFVETIAALNRQPADLGHRDTIVFYSDTPEFHYENPAEPCDIRSGIICSPNNFEYDEPLPEGTIRVTALANKNYWMHLPESEYEQAKRRWNERITASALGHVPDFLEHIVDTDMFTPRTIRKFTGHINGAVYGAPTKRWDGTTRFENLYLCGTDQGFLGIVGSMISGISIANQHLLK
jgi:phytoene dehydrogenase-like protein